MNVNGAGDRENDPDRSDARATPPAAQPAVNRLGALGLVLGTLATSIAIVQSVFDARATYGIDLFRKVVSARMLLAGFDPYVSEIRALRVYSTTWDVTFTPPVIALYATFARLPYRTERGLWVALEWAALFASIGVLSIGVAPRGRAVRRLFVGVALLFFAGGYLFRLHVERGQYYVFELLLLALGSAALLRATEARTNRWRMPALAFGLAVALRPSIGAFLVPLALLGYFDVAVASVAGTIAWCVAFLPVTGRAPWRSFATGMLHLAQLTKRSLPRRAIPPDAAAKILDGLLPVWTSTTALQHRAEETTSIPRYLGYLYETLWALPSGMGEAVGLAIGAVACSAFLVILVLRTPRELRFLRTPEVDDPRAALLAASTYTVLVDSFTPARWSYADVLLLLPLALAASRLIARPKLGLLVLAGLVLGQSPAVFGVTLHAWSRCLFVTSVLLVLSVPQPRRS